MSTANPQPPLGDPLTPPRTAPRTGAWSRRTRLPSLPSPIITSACALPRPAVAATTTPSPALSSARAPANSLITTASTPRHRTIPTHAAPVPGGSTARPRTDDHPESTTIYEESLHFVRVHRTPRISISHIDRNPPTSTDTLAYPHPPSPPDSDEDLILDHRVPVHHRQTPHRVRPAHVPSHQHDPHFLSADSLSADFLSARDTFSDHLSSVPTNKPPPSPPPLPPPPHHSAFHSVSLDDDATTAITAATTTTVVTTATGTTTSSNTSSKRSRVRMAARTVSKPIRRSYVGMVAGLASTVGLGQAMFLKATYQSPPDARGPRSGVERPVRGGETLSSAEGHVTRIVANSPSASAATDASQSAVAKAVDSAIESVKKQISNIDLSPIVEQQDGRTVTKLKRILIIGDSLVSGVGGESSFNNGPSDGPALPRQVARDLSEMLNVDVQWNAMSLTGGDVRMLKRKIVPMLTRERERGTIGDISAVVLVTGVNDWKRISPIRTAKKFKEDLEEFIEKIREQVGQQVSVFLPAIPGVRHTPRFHEPLRSIVVFLNDYWDSQKVQLSRTMDKVYFVGQPPTEEWGANPGEYFSTLDRVHPSELGYQRWATRIAEHMVTAFQKGLRAANSVATGTVSHASQKASVAASSAVEQAADVAGAAKADISKATAAVAGVTSGKHAVSPSP